MDKLTEGRYRTGGTLETLTASGLYATLAGLRSTHYVSVGTDGEA